MRSLKADPVVLVALITMCASLLAFGVRTVLHQGQTMEARIDALYKSSEGESDQINEANQFADVVMKATDGMRAQWNDVAKTGPAEQQCPNAERYLEDATMALGSVEGYELSKKWGGANARNSAVALFTADANYWRSFAGACERLGSSGKGHMRRLSRSAKVGLRQDGLKIMYRGVALISAMGELVAKEKDWQRHMHHELRATEGALSEAKWKDVLLGFLPFAVGLLGLEFLVPRALRLALGSKGGKRG